MYGSGASFASSPSVASRMRRCWASSCGRPSVEPPFIRVNVARGGAAFRVFPGLQLVSAVAMPSCSSSLATSPTDWQQIGQAGTSSAACAFSAFATSRMAGATVSTAIRASGR